MAVPRRANSLLDAKLKIQAEANELEALYLSVTGVGVVTARTLSNELGDMSQFATVHGGVRATLSSLPLRMYKFYINK